MYIATHHLKFLVIFYITYTTTNALFIKTCQKDMENAQKIEFMLTGQT